jgi:hypothetical protein
LRREGGQTLRYARQKLSVKEVVDFWGKKFRVVLWFLAKYGISREIGRLQGEREYKYIPSKQHLSPVRLEVRSDMAYIHRYLQVKYTQPCTAVAAVGDISQRAIANSLTERITGSCFDLHLCLI